MRIAPVAATLIFALASGIAWAQLKDGVVAVGESEGIVKVTKVDRTARTVTVRGPTGAEVTLKVPVEAQNLDQVKPGAVFKMRYVEAAALVLSKGGSASASAEKTVRLAPKGGNPGGVVVNTRQITGTLEAIERGARTIAVKGPRGNVVVLKVADEAKGFDDIAMGDSISILYSEALAMEMVPRTEAAKPSGSTTR